MKRNEKKLNETASIE